MIAIRVGIAILLAFAVLAFGAVETWAYAALEIGVAVLFALWGLLAFRQGQVRIRWTPLYLPMLGFGGVVLLQWLCGFSVYPYLTKVEWLKLAAYFLLFFLAAQSFRTAEQVRPFIWFLLALGFAVALFGIIQHFAFNGKLYWLRELGHGGAPFGPYVNRNHFAGFVELIAPLGLALLFLGAVRRDQLPLLGLFTIVPIGALFLSASRGGISSFFFQLALLAFLLWVSRRGRKRIAGATTFILLSGTFVVWLGMERALQRFGLFWSGELPFAGRMTMSNDTWKIFLDHPWVGTGLGTLLTVYPQYASDYFEGKVVDHAHNDYVEMLAETGLMGALSSLGFVVLLFWSALSGLASEEDSFAFAVRLGALVACSGLLLHSLVDFNFHIPSNAVLFFLLALLATLHVRQPAAALSRRAGQQARPR